MLRLRSNAACHGVLVVGACPPQSDNYVAHVRLLGRMFYAFHATPSANSILCLTRSCAISLAQIHAIMRRISACRCGDNSEACSCSSHASRAFAMIAVECVILAEAGNHSKKDLQTSLTLALLRSAAVSWNLELFEDRQHEDGRQRSAIYGGAFHSNLSAALCSLSRVAGPSREQIEQLSTVTRGCNAAESGDPYHRNRPRQANHGLHSLAEPGLELFTNAAMALPFCSIFLVYAACKQLVTACGGQGI